MPWCVQASPPCSRRSATSKLSAKDLHRRTWSPWLWPPSRTWWAVARGELPLDPGPSMAVLGPGSALINKAPANGAISPHELATLALVADGLSNKAIARRLEFPRRPSRPTSQTHSGASASRTASKPGSDTALATVREHEESAPRSLPQSAPSLPLIHHVRARCTAQCSGYCGRVHPDLGRLRFK